MNKWRLPVTFADSQTRTSPDLILYSAVQSSSSAQSGAGPLNFLLPLPAGGHQTGGKTSQEQSTENNKTQKF